MCVNVATGVVTLTEIEFHFSGAMPFSPRRSYSSACDQFGILGHGWSHDLERSARADRGAVTLYGPGREEVSYDQVAIDQVLWVDRESLASTRIYRSADSVTVWTPDRRRLIFSGPALQNGAWPLREMADLNRNALRLGYDELGRLTHVADSSRREFSLSYKQGLLIEITLKRPGDSPILLAHYDYDAKKDLVAATDATGVAQTYEYADHLIVRSTNRLGGSRYYCYDRFRKCVSTWLEGGVLVRNLEFDTLRRNTVMSDSHGWRTLYRFNETDLCYDKVDSLGQSKRTFFAADNSPLASEDEDLGPISLTEYTPATRELTTTDPSGAVTVTQFNQLNLVIQSTDSGGNVRRAEYDNRGNQLNFTTAMGHQWKHTFDSHGRVTRVVDPSGREFFVEYADGGSRVIYHDRLGTMASLEYDYFGRLVAATDAAGRRSQRQYDLSGRLVSVTSPNSARLLFRYDAAGHVVEIAGPLGARHRRVYDRHGLLINSVDSADRQLRFEYDVEQRLVAIVNSRDERSIIDYDRLGRPVRLKSFDGQEESYGFDAQGYVISVKSSAGDDYSLEYDAMRKLLARHHSDGRATVFAYDLVGRLISAENPWSQIEFEYDADGRLVHEQQQAGKVSYKHDECGRLTEIRLRGQPIAAYSYDARGRLARIEDASGLPFVFRYNQDGTSTEVVGPGGVVQRSSYGPLGQLERRSVRTEDGSVVHDREYSYDLTGRVVAIKDHQSGSVTTYRYDRSRRLEEVVRDGTVVEQYEFDSAGNPIRSHDCTHYVYGTGNTMTRAGRVSCAYDSHARVSSRENDGVRSDFEYGFEGMFTRVTRIDGSSTDYHYDPFHRRIAKIHADQTICFAWSGDRLIEQSASDGAVSYTYPPEGFQPLSESRGGNHFAYVLDHMGTPMALLGMDGAVAVEGAPAGFDVSDISSWQFPGQFRDTETGLIYNRFRYFDPVLRRYTAPDPLGGGAITNRYAYAENDPANLMDPLGLACYRPECDDAFKRMDNAMNTEHHPPAPVTAPHPGAQVPNHKGLVQRIAEFAANTGWMPVYRNAGDPAGGGSGQANTVYSHYEEYWRTQDHLQRAQTDWWANGCHPSNTSNPARAEQVANQADQLATHTPPPPANDPAQSQLMEGIRMFRMDAASGLWLPVLP
jgi:RHS repeat-associated protein